jgi:hypothetical protein
MKLEGILFKKAQEGRLAHFYITETSGEFEDSRKKIFDFVHSFIRDYYQKIEGQKNSLDNLMDHPDVLVMGQRSEDKKEAAFYSVLEAEELARFFQFKGVQSKRKFVVIHDAHRINQIVANKWLKLLEEPPQNATIFLLNPKKVRLLDTIHSRALHLRLEKTKTETDYQNWDLFLEDLKSMKFSGFLEKYSRGDLNLSYWMNMVLDWEAKQIDSIEAKSALQDFTKVFQEMELFHQPTATKWTLFYSHLKEHVLPRL